MWYVQIVVTDVWTITEYILMLNDRHSSMCWYDPPGLLFFRLYILIFSQFTCTYGTYGMHYVYNEAGIICDTSISKGNWLTSRMSCVKYTWLVQRSFLFPWGSVFLLLPNAHFLVLIRTNHLCCQCWYPSHLCTIVLYSGYWWLH